MNKENCKFCKSENTIAIKQYSDEDGKIITTWKCKACNKKFKTKW